MIWSVVSVAIGGALGAVSRYLTGLLFLRLAGPYFPWATLTVNVVGSFLIGLVFVATLDAEARRPLLIAGFLGGFTTFSAFSLETMTLLEAGRTVAALSYVGASVLFSITAAALGLSVGRALFA